MTLAFFTVSALDVLGVLFTRTTSEERREYTEWIYRCQHPHGGFRGFPGTDFGDLANDNNAAWDPANLAATFFAVSGLCVLGDDLKRLDRAACLKFIQRLQMGSGCFAELRSGDGELVGGGDPRFAYMAASLRWMIRGPSTTQSDLPDIDVDALIRWVGQAEVREGVLSRSRLNRG